MTELKWKIHLKQHTHLTETRSQIHVSGKYLWMVTSGWFELEAIEMDSLASKSSNMSRVAASGTKCGAEFEYAFSSINSWILILYSCYIINK